MAGNCLYERLKQQVSYDNGATWQDTGVYSTGSLIERDSPSCGYITEYAFLIPNIGRQVTTSLTSSAQTITYQVVSTKNGESTPYTYTAPSWCSVSKTSTGVSISVNANNTGTDRMDSVILTQSGSSLVIRITISQAYVYDPYVFTFNDSTTAKSINAEGSGGSFSYQVISTYSGSSTGFTVSSSSTWLTATVSDQGISLVISDNTGETRSGLVTATQNGSDKTITISVVQAELSPEYQYLTVEALVDNFNFDVEYESQYDGVSCSVNGGEWVYLDRLSQTINTGDTIRFKCSGGTAYETFRFQSEDSFNVWGNAGSVIFGDSFSPIRGGGSLHAMFAGTGVVDASGLFIPHSVSCENMFAGCTSLVTAPASLPQPGAGYYTTMFQDCTSLVTPPVLSATTLAEGCYMGMFEGCTSLATAPALPATTLAASCYSGMFNGCTSLTTAPSLPATTLVDECYSGMFAGCTSLTTAPALPAPTLINGEGADTYYCYFEMFKGCTSLTNAPVLPAAYLTYGCYESMFSGCTNLSGMTCLATDISEYACTNNWVSGVASSGTFVKASTMTGWGTGKNGIPSGWTVVNA